MALATCSSQAHDDSDSAVFSLYCIIYINSQRESNGGGYFYIYKRVYLS